MKLSLLTAGLFLIAVTAVFAESPASPAPSPSVAAQPASPASAPALRIVFVDKKAACACTRTAVDEGWKTLESTLGPKSKVPVTRLFMDTQADQVAVYRSKRPMVALPAIYVIDRADSIVGMLQGEIKAADLQKLLK
jgi:hypothetical protein